VLCLLDLQIETSSSIKINVNKNSTSSSRNRNWELLLLLLASDCIIGVKRRDMTRILSNLDNDGKNLGKTQKMSAGRESASMIEKRIFCFLNKIFKPNP